MHASLKSGRFFLGRLGHNEDLLLSLTAFCREHGVKAGVLTVIGAVANGVIGYYDQKKKCYTPPIKIEKKLEISSCSGNISLKYGEVFVHAHIVFSDAKGKTFGGHLMQGTRIFAAEFSIRELKGKHLNRLKDPLTGLYLWR